MTCGVVIVLAGSRQVRCFDVLSRWTLENDKPELVRHFFDTVFYLFDLLASRSPAGFEQVSDQIA